MNARGGLCRYGEDLAARRLRKAGMAILERNWRCREGELDIVARQTDTLVICEVKTRRAGGPEPALAAVGPRKTAQLRRLAARWLSERWIDRYGALPSGGVRLDVVAITLPPRGAPCVEHVRGVG
ncbi:YraN family protein [Streptomyces alkaliterrae]|uniref:UPF0102 protein FNX44_010295 n=1 Tax=Streptomyces alkaliterrae TaxID=2213162 RepID=A0A5P0YPS5_9ACTN|nr:YraN family protein [Streptomyces alkaliterrae]MBB1252347.1 YraN family protein [Streptomyces alkaliterrae]MBB1257243.1 YraN family protein [Streptomyces alkaliterrae]MQS02258.1 YraN family protein [Streptomyces alkaliterrae]